MSKATNDTQLLDDLRRVFRDGLSVEPVEPIVFETRFFADLGLASIDAVVLGEELQKHYGRKLPFSEMLADLGAREERDMTMKELIAFLRENL